jgi:hypothetical protein
MDADMSGLFHPDFDSNTVDPATFRREIVEILGILEQRFGPRDDTCSIKGVLYSAENIVRIGIGGRSKIGFLRESG